MKAEKFINRIMHKMKKIKFEDIQPVGNFKSLLETCRDKADSIIAKCHEEKSYRSSLAEMIKLIVGELGILYALEDGLENLKLSEPQKPPVHNWRYLITKIWR